MIVNNWAIALGKDETGTLERLNKKAAEDSRNAKKAKSAKVTVNLGWTEGHISTSGARSKSVRKSPDLQKVANEEKQIEEKKFINQANRIIKNIKEVPQDKVSKKVEKLASVLFNIDRELERA